MHLSKSILISLITLTAASRAFSCDLCGCYTPRLQVIHDRPVGFYFSVAEQFTHFSVDRFNGDKIDNPTGQHLDSSITQAVIGAAFLGHRLGLQLNVPYIYRSYKRPEGFAIEHGDESGLGDLSLLTNVVVFRTGEPPREEPGTFTKDGKTPAPMRPSEPDFSAALSLIAGIKFPTGDASRLREEFNEVEVEGAPESGIHGHDLALGTGAYDGIFGAALDLRYRALFFQADVHYALRGSGRYSYRYADDLQWNGGPGVYLYRRDRDAIGLQCVISGETKGYDRFQGERALDTGLTSLYVGPRITGSVGNVRGEVGVDLPVIMNTTAFQTTPEYRIRAGFTIQF